MSGGPPALGERSRLALSGSLQLCELLAQPLVGRRHLGNLPLQLGVLSLQPLDQRHQLVAFTGREGFGLTHTQSLRYLPSTTTTPTRASNRSDRHVSLPLASRPQQANYTVVLRPVRTLTIESDTATPSNTPLINYGTNKGKADAKPSTASSFSSIHKDLSLSCRRQRAGKGNSGGQQ